MCNNIPSDKLTFCVEWLVKQFIARFWFDHVHKLMVIRLLNLLALFILNWILFLDMCLSSNHISFLFFLKS